MKLIFHSVRPELTPTPFFEAFVAQSVAHQTSNLGAAGSSPAGGIFFFYQFFFIFFFLWNRFLPWWVSVLGLTRPTRHGLAYIFFLTDPEFKAQDPKGQMNFSPSDFVAFLRCHQDTILGKDDTSEYSAQLTEKLLARDTLPENLGQSDFKNHWKFYRDISQDPKSAPQAGQDFYDSLQVLGELSTVQVQLLSWLTTHISFRNFVIAGPILQKEMHLSCFLTSDFSKKPSNLCGKMQEIKVVDALCWFFLELLMTLPTPIPWLAFFWIYWYTWFLANWVMKKKLYVSTFSSAYNF